MSSNMDPTDKTFFSNLLDKIERRLETIQIHQQKTCDELNDVDKKVVELKTDFKNHLDYAKNDENRKWKVVSAVMAGAVVIVMILGITQ